MKPMSEFDRGLVFPAIISQFARFQQAARRVQARTVHDALGEVVIRNWNVLALCVQLAGNVRTEILWRGILVPYQIRTLVSFVRYWDYSSCQAWLQHHARSSRAHVHYLRFNTFLLLILIAVAWQSDKS